MQDEDSRIKKPRSGRSTIIAFSVVAVVLLAVGAVAFMNWPQVTTVQRASTAIAAASPLSTTTPLIPVGEPAFIKELGANDEGYRGIAIYFVLGDSNGQEIAAAGDATLLISEANGHTLLSLTGAVMEPAFTYFTFDDGRTALQCSFGRVSYDLFDAQPTQRRGQVRITFTTSTGHELVKTQDVLFDQ